MSDAGTRVEPIEHSPLDEETLSAMARKAASPAAPRALREMAARGMAPLPPADLVLVLYQLCATTPPEEAEIREVARKTASTLPEAVLQGALAQPADPRVLDFYARALLTRGPLLRLILLNHATADATFAHVARTAGDDAIEIIAANEQRLLRLPAIITALYLNPRTRMSVAQRAVELAVRNGIELEGVPSFAEVKAAILSEREAGHTIDASMDLAFAAAIAQGTPAPVVPAMAAVPEPEPSAEEAEGPAEEPLLGDATSEFERAMQLAKRDEAEAADAAAIAALEGQGDQVESASVIAKLPMSAKLRLATVGNSFARAVLVRDSNRVIAMAAIRSPAVNDHEAERYASNRSLHEDVVRYIAQQKQFTKRYSIKLQLVNNPKCPLQSAIVFLGFLTAKDLRQVARSKGVPAPLSKAAKALVEKRESR